MGTVNVFVREYFTQEYNFVEIMKSTKEYEVNEPGISTRKVDHDPCVADCSKFDTEEEAQNKAEKSEEESVRRTKRDLKFLILNNCLSTWRFVTLTYEGVGTFDRGKIARDIQKMVERLEAHLKRDLRYICAYELHPGGHGFHAHLLMDVPYYKNEVFQARFWQMGFVKLEKLKIGKNPRRMNQVVRYLTKYITKEALKAGIGKKRYSSSRNLIRQPYRISYLIRKKNSFTKLISKYRKKGYSLCDNYTMDLDGELVEVFIYHRARPVGDGLPPIKDFTNRLLNAFGGELLPTSAR